MLPKNNFPTTTGSKSTWIRFVRIALGIVLLWKGVNFLSDTAAVQSLLGHSYIDESAGSDAALIVILGLLTIVCGLSILVDYYTRVAAFIQLPVFLIGTLFIHGGHIERYGMDLVLTIIVPFLLLFFITRDTYGIQASSRKNIIEENGNILSNKFSHQKK